MTTTYGHHSTPSQSSSLSTTNLAAPSPYQTSSTQTRILLLSDFDPQLKTRDLMDLLSQWEGERGGFKVKWRDDTSAWIVFNDPTIAKRAFLTLLTQPPPSLLPPNSTSLHPHITPYTGSDVSNILQAVQNRPRSRSINAGSAMIDTSGSGGHSRKSSFAGSSSGGAIGLGSGSGGGGVMNSPTGGGGSIHHSRTQSWGRSSLDRRAAKEMIQGSINPSSSSNSVSNISNSTLPSFANRVPLSTGDSTVQDRSSSPESSSLGHGGIVAGEPPRRIGQNHNHTRDGSTGSGSGGGLGHRRSMSDAVGSRVAGSTIRE